MWTKWPVNDSMKAATDISAGAASSEGNEQMEGKGWEVQSPW